MANDPSHGVGAGDWGSSTAGNVPGNDDDRDALRNETTMATGWTETQSGAAYGASLRVITSSTARPSGRGQRVIRTDILNGLTRDRGKGSDANCGTMDTNGNARRNGPTAGPIGSVAADRSVASLATLNRYTDASPGCCLQTMW